MRDLRIIGACVITLLAALAVAAQPGPSAPTHLALEVYTNPGQPPSYIQVPAAGKSPHWTWFPKFRRVPVAAGSDRLRPVTAVNVRAINAGDRVLASISVFLGERFEVEKTVAVYTLQEREKVSVRQLLNFDIEPFEVKLVRLEIGPAELPRVISKVGSIELVTIQPTLTTLPGYRLTLRNLSPKNVSAVMIYVRQGNRRLFSGMPQGEEGKALIPADSMADLVLPASTDAVETGGGYEPVALREQTIEILTAAFDDGSSEGEPTLASRYGKLLDARRIELRTIIDLFQQALDADLSDPPTAIKAFENKMAVINPSGGVRIHVISEIRRFRLTKPDSNTESYRDWLQASKQKYEAWLARI